MIVTERSSVYVFMCVHHVQKIEPKVGVGTLSRVSALLQHSSITKNWHELQMTAHLFLNPPNGFLLGTLILILSVMNEWNYLPVVHKCTNRRQLTC